MKEKNKVPEILGDLILSVGNTYLSLAEIGKRISVRSLESEVKKGNVVEVFYNKKCLYTLPYIVHMEKRIAEEIVKYVHSPLKLSYLPEEDIDRYIDEFETIETERLGFKFGLHEEQRNAVKMAANSQMSIITGGPGTGKTCVLNAINYIEKKRRGGNADILFTAPTGKAARRITESVGVAAKTIQKQIGANSREDNPVKILVDVFIVDEISMLDTEIAYLLLRALYKETKLILVGDVDQLPSVGIGSVLRDFIDSLVIPVTKLEKTFRQGAETCIAKNISYLRQGYPKLDEGDDFEIKSVNIDSIQNDLIQSVLQNYERFGRENVILLTPYRRKGSTCANVMNALLQNAVNPIINNLPHLEYVFREEDEETGAISEMDISFRLGDPVMQLVNREDCPVANGDVGKIVEVYKSGILVDYGDCLLVYKTKDLNQLNLAYAMSVHKSQGSEYKCVITSVLPEHGDLMNRNMVYTAVTRAKKHCILFVDKTSLTKALTIEGGYIRTTMLATEIQKENQKYILIESTKKVAV